MKASIYLFALLLTCVLFISASCTKEENSCVQKNDCNILEWKVDGKKYKAECESGPLFGCDAVDCQYYHDTKTLEFVGVGENGAVGVYKYKSLIITGQNNTFGQHDKLNFRSRYNDNNCIVYSLDTNSKYSFIINNVDTVSKYIEGEYSFTGINDCQDTVKVSDGYFKLSYRP